MKKSTLLNKQIVINNHYMAHLLEPFKYTIVKELIDIIQSNDNYKFYSIVYREIQLRIIKC